MYQVPVTVLQNKVHNQTVTVNITCVRDFGKGELNKI